MSLRRRTGAVGLLAAVILLAGCTVAASREGQEQVDAAIASAGLTGQLEATYSCSGALPGRVDSCLTRVTMSSDDRSLIEKAAAIPELQGAQMELHYRGADAALAPEDVALLWRIYDTIGDAVGIEFVSVDPAQPGVTVSASATLTQGCASAAALAPDFTGVTVSGDAESTEWSVRVEPGQDLSALCGQAQSFLDGGELSGVVLVSLTQTPSGLQLIEVRADDTAEETARAWFAEHPLPAGMEARVS